MGGSVTGKSSGQQGLALASVNHLDQTTVQHAVSSSPFKPFTIALVGQMISGKNRVQVRRDGTHFPLKQFTNWRAQAHFQILEQRPALPPAIDIPVTLYCQYWPADKKTRDVDGMLSALFHLLVYAKVLKDDGLIYTCRWWRYPQTEFPKLILEISPWS